MGLHMGLESPHRKSFDPLHDLGAPLIHFDFSKVARTSKFPATTVNQRINDTLASTGAITQIRIKSGDAFSTATFPDAGIVLIDDEYLNRITFASMNPKCASWNIHQAERFFIHFGEG